MGKGDKDKDYKCKTSFTKKEYIPDPTPQTQTIIESIQDKDNSRGHNHQRKRFDYFTGNWYRFKVQKKFGEICGDRGSGLFSLSPILKGDIGFVSKKPGIALPKAWVTRLTVDQGYHCIGRYLYAKSSHPMKPNIISMANETEIEIPNAKLIHISQEELQVSYGICVNAGKSAAIVALTDIPANTFITLAGYSNDKQYPYGTKEFLGLEKKCIEQYQKNKEELKGKGGRFKVCKLCCEKFSSRPKGLRNKHIKNCKKNLLTRMWKEVLDKRKEKQKSKRMK